MTAKVVPPAACRRLPPTINCSAMDGRPSGGSSFGRGIIRRCPTRPVSKGHAFAWRARSRSSPARPPGWGGSRPCCSPPRGPGSPPSTGDDTGGTVEEVTAAGGEALAVSCDVTDAESVRGGGGRARSPTFGRLHVLYNNAGVILPDDDGAVDTPESTWDTRHGREPQGRLARLQARHPGDARSRRRLDRQRRVVRRAHGRGDRADRLHRVSKGGGAGDDPGDRGRVHARAGHPGQRAVPRADRRPRCSPSSWPTRRGQAAPARAHPDGTPRRGRGDGERPRCSSPPTSRRS